jgi:endonuclease VIII
MPEGDTIFRAAQALHRALAGKAIVRFETVLPALARVDHDHPIAGRTVESVAARGKHLLMTFSGDLVLHTHMRMNGAWHIYRPGDRWRRPAREMRLLVAAADVVAVGFNVPVAELLSARDLRRHRTLAALGPDLLDASFDRAGAVRRVAARAGEAIGDVLLDQRVMAGIGNVLKSEILFVSGVDPFRPAGTLSAAELGRIVDVALELMAMNARGTQGFPRAGRQTTRSMNPNAKLWVYGRSGQQCRRCGTVIQARKTGLDARLTYWCSRCQL